MATLARKLGATRAHGRANVETMHPATDRRGGVEAIKRGLFRDRCLRGGSGL